ncbi:PAS domain-containing protein [Chondrinema litorale]|uniref:PAS domain-containing protein n=1 Tax=Chondrinema litorale TaxID=2994555 RepID=UPI002542A4DD|nr:PAS domain-containing protein [Chondrinema litorale]UZR99907.1 PAS domain-containing protein [Chondrinema litorale]
MINLSKYLASNTKLLEAQDTLAQLKKEISSATLFVKKIEEGELDTPYPGVNENDFNANSLSGSLISMRNQLKSMSETESQRKWITEGLAYFSEVLRKNQQELEETSYEIICNLVKYVKANQGGIYIVDTEEQVLELKGCYAYDRKKFIDKKFEFGEGLIGQIYLEKETLLMSDIPDNYINITSGLGDAPPRSIVIVPLKVNDEVLGIIELASFTNFEAYQVEFLEKLGENIASSISTIQINEKTQELLSQSQKQAEELRTQEEEMKQNLEEMQATQEELARKDAESQSVLSALNTAYFVAEINKNGEVQSSNKQLTNLINKVFGVHHIEGENYKKYSNSKVSFEKIIEDVFNGGNSSRVASFAANDQKKWLFETYSPIFDNQKQIKKILMVASDITHGKEQELELVKIQDQIMTEKGRMESFMNSYTDDIFILDKDREVIQVNASVNEKFRNVGIEVQVGSSVYNYVEDNDDDELLNKKFIDYCYDSVAKGETVSSVRKYYLGDQVGYYNVSFFPLKSGDGVIGAGLVSRDITEQRLLQDQIISEKGRMDSFMDSTKDQILLLDIDFKIKNANKQSKDFYKKNGLEIKEGENLFEYLSEADRKTMKLDFEKVLKGETLTFEKEVVFQNASKSYSQIVVFPLTVAGKIEGIGVITRDITEQKLLQDQIIEEKGRMESFMNSTTDNIFLLDKDAKIVQVNNTVLESYGKRNIEVQIGMSLFDLTTDDDLENMKRRFNNALSGRASSEESKYTMGGFDNYFQSNVFPLKSHDEIIGVGIVSRDITGRKMLELESAAKNEELLASEEELRQNMEELSATQEEMQRVMKEIQDSESFMKGLVNSTTDTIFTIDKDFKLIVYNDVFRKTWESFGFRVDKGMHMSTYYTDTAEWETYVKLFKRCFGGEQFTTSGSKEIGGDMHYFLFVYSPIYDVSNNVISAAVFAKDVTEEELTKQQNAELLKETQEVADELKAQEEELRQNMEELSAIQEMVMQEKGRMESFMNSTTDNIFILDKAGDIIQVNEPVKEIFRAQGVEVKSGMSLLDLTEEHQKESIKNNLIKASKGESTGVELKYTFEGFNNYYHTQTFPLQSDGEVIGIGVVTRDITDRKRLEEEAAKKHEELMASEEELRQNIEEMMAIQDQVIQEKGRIESFINSTSDSIMLLDTEGKFINLNSNAADLFSQSGKAIKIGVPIYDYIDAKVDNEKIRTRINNALAGKTEIEEERHDIAGNKVYLQVHTFPLKSEGNIIGVALITRDITERKLLEEEAAKRHEELMASEEELRQNMEELSATQDEMQRIMVEVQNSEAFMKGLINSTTDTIFTLDHDLRLVIFNKVFRNTWEQLGFKVEKGTEMQVFYKDPKEWDTHESLFRRALSGEVVTLNTSKEIGNETMYFDIIYTPIRNNSNRVIAAAVFAKDITEAEIAKRQNAQLLKESQQQTEELKAQEEELRQNMEELSATQEEMQRIMLEVQDNEAFLKGLINSTSDTIFTVDRNLELINFNKVFADTWESLGVEVAKGVSIETFYTDPEELKQHKSYLKKALSGEQFNLNVSKKIGETVVYFSIVYSPIEDKDGKVIAASIFGKDVTQEEISKRENAELLKESQQQSEELKAQEEELRQNMEELTTIQDMILEEKGRMESFMNSTTNSIFILDKEANIIQANAVIKNSMKEYGIEVTTGMSVFDIIAPHEIEGAKKDIELALAGETTRKEVSYESETLNGYLDIQTFPLYSNGEIIGVSIVSSDITERKSLEKDAAAKHEELMASEEELRQNLEEISTMQDMIVTEKGRMESFMNSTSDNIFLLDKDANIIQANDAVKEVYRQHNIEVKVGMSLFELVTEDDKKNITRNIKNALKGKSTNEEKKYDLGEFNNYYQTHTFPLKSNKEIVGVGIVTRDITAQKRTALEVATKHDELMASEEELRQNLEQMKTIQEMLNERNLEVESIRQEGKAKTEALLKEQQEIMKKFEKRSKSREAELMERIKQLEAAVSKK